ncbi:transmembrane protein [Achlya hypogyna]|uniref:Transmembrane protein n=1 Tax=Achlya hypogyna TaxID=1202772 RepID=A0A1V9YG82_ACHHY|nr:transmembrane protein [Achlya hypogyna]
MIGFSVVAKRFLNLWNFLVLALACAVLIVTIYILTCQSDVHAVPSLGYIAAVVCAGILVFLSGLGLYGLRRHRHCITTGKRNFALGSYVILGLATGVVLVLAGSVALTLNSVVAESQGIDFADVRVGYLEEAMIESLHSYAEATPAGWTNMQNNWFCCGYYNTTALADFIELEAAAHARTLNAMPGIYCTTNCTTGLAACPKPTQTWCRDVFLKNAATNNAYVGWTSVVAGGAQLFAIVLGVYILMCDIRMLQQKSSRHLVQEKA